MVGIREIRGREKMRSIHKLLAGLFFGSLMFLSFISTTSAERIPIQRMMQFMNLVQGIWYGVENSSDIITFNGGLLNGNRIIGFEDIVGAEEVIGGDYIGKMVVKKDGEDKIIAMRAQNLSPSDRPNYPYHQYLRLGETTYSRSPVPLYGESVGGIFLGMPVAKLVELYGLPDMTERKFGYEYYAYIKLGMLLDIKMGIVQQIRIYRVGNRKLDNTMLDCNNSLDEFRKAYGFSTISKTGSNSIKGKEEFLWFKDYPQSIALSLHWGFMNFDE